MNDFWMAPPPLSHMGVARHASHPLFQSANHPSPSFVCSSLPRLPRLPFYPAVSLDTCQALDPPSLSGFLCHWIWTIWMPPSPDRKSEPLLVPISRHLVPPFLRPQLVGQDLVLLDQIGEVGYRASENHSS